ncbi:MAG TPA: hypothetical protein VMC43_02200 [Candidatus Paceibacterota bacterium]|nr:hypothetical protein [Candidatus Paceibacterota bacterium]
MAKQSVVQMRPPEPKLARPPRWLDGRQHQLEATFEGGITVRFVALEASTNRGEIGGLKYVDVLFGGQIQPLCRFVCSLGPGADLKKMHRTELPEEGDIRIAARYWRAVYDHLARERDRFLREHPEKNVPKDLARMWSMLSMPDATNDLEMLEQGVRERRF